MPCLHTQGHLCPETASVFHFIFSEQGLIGHSKGKLTTKLCQCGAVFVETETGFDSVHLQSSIDTAQAGLGKQAFEHKMAKYEMP